MFSKTCTIALPLVLTLTLPAVAGISKNVTQEDASEGRVSVVVAAEGGGTIIDFSEMQETLMKVTIDDPSKVVIDYSAPLPVIRLFRASIPVADVPSVQRTQLTVVTQDSDRQYHTYIFPVTPSAKPALYTKFVVGGVTRNRGRSNGPGAGMTTAFGIKQAEGQRTLVDPQLKGRVRRYLQLTQGGMSDRQAAKKAGISMALVQRLDALGQGSVSVAQSLPATKPSVLPVPVAPTTAATPKSQPKQSIALERPNSAWASAVVVPPGAVHSSQHSTSVQPQKNLSSQVYANALLRGLNKARLDGEIRYRSAQWFLVNGAIRLLRRGSSLNKAIAVSGMKHDKFMELLSDGGLES